MKTRYDQFLSLVNTCLILQQLPWHAALRALEAVADPAVQTNINQGEDETVFKKAHDYLAFVSGAGKKPFWLVSSTDGPMT